MAGIRHQVVVMDHKATANFNIKNDSIQFTSKAISIRKDKHGRREVRLKWIPQNLLVDEWVPLHQATTTKTVKVCNLPEAAKARLQHELLLKPQNPKQSRKTKRVEPPSPFLPIAWVPLVHLVCPTSPTKFELVRTDSPLLTSIPLPFLPRSPTVSTETVTDSIRDDAVFALSTKCGYTCSRTNPYHYGTADRHFNPATTPG